MSSAIAGLEIAMTPHSLRHAFARRILEATSDLAVVQDMLGHLSPLTTRIYARASYKRMPDAHRTAFGCQLTPGPGKQLSGFGALCRT